MTKDNEEIIGVANLDGGQISVRRHDQLGISLQILMQDSGGASTELCFPFPHHSATDWQEHLKTIGLMFLDASNKVNTTEESQTSKG